MFRDRLHKFAYAMGVSTGLFLGCGGGEEFKTHTELPPPSHDHDHDHGKPGPHGGSLVELGEEEYHAELLIDHDAHVVRVYLLDKEGKTAVPTAATELSVDTGSGEVLLLKPARQESDPEGQASVFELVDDAVVHDLLDAGFIHGKLTVAIGEKTLTGGIDAHFDHDHDHKDEKPAAPAGEAAAPADAAAPAEAAPAEAAPAKAE